METELVWIGNKEIRGCIACGICGKTGDKHCVFAEDCCNELIAKAAECDGFIVGSPVYYAGMAGSLRALMDRMFYAGGTNFRMKPAAGRRCGAPGRGHRGGRPDQQVLPDQLPAHCVQLLLEHCLRAQPPARRRATARACTPCACSAATWPGCSSASRPARAAGINAPEMEPKVMTNVVREDLLGE